MNIFLLKKKKTLESLDNKMHPFILKEKMCF